MSEREHDDLDDYLFRGEGEPDPEVARLERMLAPLAWKERELELPGEVAPPARSLGLWRALLGSAAAAALLFVLGVWQGNERTPGYRVFGVANRTIVRPGDELATEDVARLEIGDIGEVEVAPGSLVRVDDAGARNHKLYLARGGVQATILAPPRLFQVGTPAGLTVDLGCEYRLDVDDAGRSTLRVTTGQVAFELDGREVYVPAGASCTSVPGRGPSAPVFDDAEPEFVAAVARVEFTREPDPADLEIVFARREREYGLTLWHLLDAPSEEVRARALQWLADRFELPRQDGVTLEGVRRGDREQRARWMEEMKPHWRGFGQKKLDFGKKFRDG